MHSKNDEVNKLLKILNRKRDRKLKAQDSTLDFIEFYNIKPGKHKVPIIFIRKLYNSWSKEKLRSQNQIIRLLHEYFITNARFIFLNKSSIELHKQLASFFESKKTTSSHTKKIARLKQFLDEKKIENGNYFIEDFVLFYLYKEWLKKKNKIIGRSTFNRIIKLYLTNVRLDEENIHFFGINQDLSLTPQRMAAVKRWTNEKKEANKKKSK